MRILAIAPTGFFADYGCHVRIRGQMAALAKRGHTVRIVTYPGGRDVDNLPTCRPPLWPRGRDMPIGSSWRKVLLDAALTPTALAAALRFPGGPPEMVHAYLHEGALIGFFVARLLGAALVFDFQGSLTAEMLDHRFLSPRSPALPWLRRLERWIDHRPQALLASSHHAAQHLTARFQVPPQRVFTVPDSVDPQIFRPCAEVPAQRLAALRRRLDLPAGRPVLVYLGLLAPYQGIDLLLAALHRLARGPTPPFTLIMGFPNVAPYQALAEALGLRDHVRFTGAVPYEEAPLYLALGDLAVAPKLSATEGSGKLLTYMAVGLPVVAFDTPVHREYLGDLGFYAPAGDAAGLAAALQRALQDPTQAAQRGRLLRQRVLQRYTWAAAAQQIETIYRAVGATGAMALA